MGKVYNKEGILIQVGNWNNDEFYGNIEENQNLKI